MSAKEYSEHEVIEKVGGRFKLTSLLEKRYRELVFGSRPLADVDSEDPLDLLIAEVLEDKIELVSESEAIAAAAASLLGGEAEAAGQAAAAAAAVFGDAPAEGPTIADYFAHPALASIEEVRESSSLPDEPGIYAWYFDEKPPNAPAKGCTSVGESMLLYVGKAGKEGLKTRILELDSGGGTRGTAYGSTLRKSLGCLLRSKLRLKPEGSQRRWTFGKGEEKLSTWMAEHARVAWLSLADRQQPWNRGNAEDDGEALTRVEKLLISKYSLPLNIVYNPQHPFCARLKELRKECTPDA